jgi:hypothetical protein
VGRVVPAIVVARWIEQPHLLEGWPGIDIHQAAAGALHHWVFKIVQP